MNDYSCAYQIYLFQIKSEFAEIPRIQNCVNLKRHYVFSEHPVHNKRILPDSFRHEDKLRTALACDFSLIQSLVHVGRVHAPHTLLHTRVSHTYTYTLSIQVCIYIYIYVCVYTYVYQFRD